MTKTRIEIEGASIDARDIFIEMENPSDPAEIVETYLGLTGKTAIDSIEFFSALLRAALYSAEQEARELADSARQNK